MKHTSTKPGKSYRLLPTEKEAAIKEAKDYFIAYGKMTSRGSKLLNYIKMIHQENFSIIEILDALSFYCEAKKIREKNHKNEACSLYWERLESKIKSIIE